MPVVNGQPTIGIIDDSEELRTVISTRLRLSGMFEVVGEGRDGRDAIGLAVRHKPAMLLLDMSMPGMDGLDALPGILAVSPETHVVIFSGFDRKGIDARVRGLGAVSFIEKSLTIDELPETLIRLYEQGLVPEPPSNSRRTERATDESMAAELLDEHLERFREVFDQGAIGMATMTLTGRVVRANPALGELMGCTHDELIGIDYGRLMAGKSHLLDAALDNINERGVDLVRVEHPIASPNMARQVLVTLAPVRDSHQRALYLLLQAQEVTAQRLAEDELRAAEADFRLLVEAVEDYAIFMLSPEGNVVSWNAGAERLKGYHAAEIIGKHFRAFYPLEMQLANHPEHELELALRDGRYREECWRIRKDGTRFWANVVITTVRDSSGRHIGFAKVTRDVSERRTADLQRDQAEESLAQANATLAAVNDRLREASAEQAESLAVAAHELRSPAAVLGGSADLLARRWGELTEDDRERLFRSMIESSGRLRGLLSDLLQLSSGSQSAWGGRAVPTNVGSVLRSVTDAFSATDPTVSVELDLHEDPEVVADPTQLIQAFDNLLRNAVTHGVPPVRITVDVVGEATEIRVSDTGPGVPPDVRDRLFEKFAAGGSTAGTGLGLFIVREMARSNGGEAFYQESSSDAEPRGAFIIALPVA